MVVSIADDAEEDVPSGPDTISNLDGLEDIEVVENDVQLLKQNNAEAIGDLDVGEDATFIVGENAQLNVYGDITGPGTLDDIGEVVMREIP